MSPPTDAASVPDQIQESVKGSELISETTRARAITIDEEQTSGHTLERDTMELQRIGLSSMYLLEPNGFKWMGSAEGVRRLHGRDTMG